MPERVVSAAGNNMTHRPMLILFVTLLMPMGFFGCSEKSEALEDTETPPEDSSGFEKPPVNHNDQCNAPIESDGPLRGLSSTAICPKPFMNPTDDFLEVWAYEDEAAVFDISTQVNRDVLDDQYVSSGTYYFYVLVDFKPAPFGLIPVNSETDFPTREDIAGVETRKRTTVDLGNHNREAFTVVIPPEAFPGSYAHDVRFIWLSKEEPPAEPTLTRGSHRYSRFVRINHGGTEYRNMSSPELDTEFVRPPQKLSPLAAKESVLLYPEYDVYDPTAESDWKNIRYGRSFSVNSQATTIHGLVPAKNTSSPTEIYLLTLRNGHFWEDGPNGHLTLPKAPEIGEDPGKFTAHFSFEAPLDAGERTDYQAIFFYDPYEISGNNIVDSNILFLERPEE